MGVIRKKSPRAPSVPLDEAIERAKKIYTKEKCHPAPADAVAKHLGYTNAANGAAASAIATLRYYGLIKRGDNKTISVSEEVQGYLYAPSHDHKRELLIKWLKTPPIFDDLLEEYRNHLPSDETLKFNLIQKGFSPEAADSCLSVFKQSVEFAEYFHDADTTTGNEPEDISDYIDSADRGAQVYPPLTESIDEPVRRDSRFHSQVGGGSRTAGNGPHYEESVQADVDRIPVRLAGGRRAWIEVPSPLYGKDKERLKAQIDLLLTDDAEEEF